jgi:hypothetical protein
MLKNLTLFIKERFPLRVTLSITIILFGAPFSFMGRGVFKTFSGGLSVFLALFCLRMADDLSDLELDRHYHPERGLSSGLINPDHLKKIILIAIGMILLFNIWAWRPLAMVTGVVLYYVFYFKKLKRRFAIILRPFFSNLIFGIIPVYAFFLSGSVIPGCGLLVCFIYIAAVAHEWSHSVHESEEGIPSIVNYSQVMGAGRSAIMGLILFGLSSLLGWLFWLKIGRSVLFGLFLMGTSLHILLLGIRLIKNPTSRNARPFYIFGFTFFLLPLAGLLIEKLL